MVVEARPDGAPFDFTNNPVFSCYFWCYIDSIAILTAA